MTLSAAHAAAVMHRRLPSATPSEVRRAARALARSFGGRWHEPSAESEFWVSSVLVNFKLQDDLRPF